MDGQYFNRDSFAYLCICIMCIYVCLRASCVVFIFFFLLLAAVSGFVAWMAMAQHTPTPNREPNVDGNFLQDISISFDVRQANADSSSGKICLPNNTQVSQLMYFGRTYFIFFAFSFIPLWQRHRVVRELKKRCAWIVTGTIHRFNFKRLSDAFILRASTLAHLNDTNRVKRAQ